MKNRRRHHDKGRQGGRSDGEEAQGQHEGRAAATGAQILLRLRGLPLRLGAKRLCTQHTQGCQETPNVLFTCTQDAMKSLPKHDMQKSSGTKCVSDL